MFVRARPWKGLPLLRLSWRVSGKNRKHHCYLKPFQYSRLVRYHFPLTPPPDEDSSCKTSRTQNVSLTSNDQSPSETILARPPKKAWAAMGWSPTPTIWPETLVLETLVLFVGLRKPNLYGVAATTISIKRVRQFCFTRRWCLNPRNSV